MGYSAKEKNLEISTGAMGDTDSSEAPGSSGGITPPILKQLADLQRRVVLLEGATERVEVRKAPASSASLTYIMQGMAHPGGYLGSNRPPKFKNNRDTWPFRQAKFTYFIGVK